jgi:hypothetical protein
LIWLGRTDPYETVAKVRSSDTHQDELIAVAEQWKLHLALDQGYTIQQIIGRALINSDLHNALMAVAPSRSGGSVSNQRLGQWLNRVKGKVVNGLKLLQNGIASGYPIWKLVRN